MKPTLYLKKNGSTLLKNKAVCYSVIVKKGLLILLYL